MKHYIISFIAIVFIYNVAFSQTKTDSLPTAQDSLKAFMGKPIQDIVIAPLASQGIEFSFGVFPLGDSIIIAQHKTRRGNEWETEANEYNQLLNKQAQTDLYIATPDGTASRLFSEDISTQKNEGAACISPSGKELFYTQSIIIKGKLHFSIQAAVKDGNTWKRKPEWAMENATISYAYPSLSPDGKILYFASTKNGSWDIFSAKRTGSQWSDTQELTFANSTDDELFPSVLNDSILFISANRSDSYGGLDLYYINTKTKTKPINLKLPFNSTADDVAITFRANNDTAGYLVSNRNPSIPKDQLFSFNIHYKKIDTLDRRTRLSVSDSMVIPVSVAFMISEPLRKAAEKQLADLSRYVKETYKTKTDIQYTPGAQVSMDVDPNQTMIDVNTALPSRAVADVKERLAAIMENLLHEENKLAQQAKETEKSSSLYERVAKTASAAATQNIAAGSVAATPVAPKEDEQEDVNLFFKSYQNNDDIEAIIEVIDPGSESLGRPKQVESKRKVALKKGGDYSVNVSVSNDDDMKIGNRNSNSQSSTLELSNNQQNLAYTENKEYEDVYNKLYTVQINALTKQVPLSYFGKLRNVKMYACMDGIYRYTYGRAANSQDAEKILANVREAGFNDAFIISLRRIEKKLQDVYAVQLAVSTTRYSADYFKRVPQVMEYVGRADDLYRYAVGRYTNMRDAMNELSRMKAVGYPKAFITNVKRFDFKRAVE